MNRLPTKQIYLLFIIIVGIIALSVYSTYALFTFENSTDDIVSIHIPKSLTISENIYEYQQVTLEPNSVVTTDIDIYNVFEYEVCYSVWYKVVGTTEIQNNVQIFEKAENSITGSGLLGANTNIRVTLVIINDNSSEVKINLGTIGTQKQDGSCSLNITGDKSVVSMSYKNIDVLSTKLLENISTTEIKENYLTYKEQTETITYKDSDKIYTSSEFTYSNELFTLTNGEYITFQELVNKNSLQSNDMYFCKDNMQCSVLYKFKLENIKIDNNEPMGTNYHINKYDKLIGYSAGINGLRKINETDYVYYGDNPNNFIYYNCSNNDDLNTCELWRIVGFFYNKETNKYTTKIVRNESIGKYQFDYKMNGEVNESTNDWNNSTINKYLNTEYKLINNYNIYLDKYIQNIERIPNLEADVKSIKVSEEVTDSQINLLSLSDYLYTSSCEKSKVSEYTKECLKNNWLYNIEIPKEWTLTSKEVEVIIEEETNNDEITDVQDETPTDSEENEAEVPEESEGTDVVPEENQDNETNNNDEVIDETESTEPVDENKYIINYVYTIGEDISETDVNDTSEVRPVVFLKPRIILLDGNGSLETPYVVK